MRHKRTSVLRTNSLFPGINKKKGRIVLNDFGVLHTFLKKIVKSNKESPSGKRRNSNKFAKSDLPKNVLRQTKSVIIREKRVKYGLEKYNDPNLKTVINKESVKNVNGKKVKEVKFKTVKRKKVKASNKLPLVKEGERKKKLSKTIFGRK